MNNGEELQDAIDKSGPLRLHVDDVKRQLLKLLQYGATFDGENYIPTMNDLEFWLDDTEK